MVGIPELLLDQSHFCPSVLCSTLRRATITVNRPWQESKGGNAFMLLVRECSKRSFTTERCSLEVWQLYWILSNTTVVSLLGYSSKSRTLDTVSSSRFLIPLQTGSSSPGSNLFKTKPRHLP